MSDSMAPPIEKITPKEKRRRQLHISSVNMLNDCGQRFMFRYILGKKNPPSAFILVGNSIDASVTKDLDSKIETGELLKRDEGIDVAATTFEEGRQREPIELDREEKAEGKTLETVLGEAKDKTVALAGLHHDEAAPAIQPVRTKRRFSVNMDTFLRSRAKEMHEASDLAPDSYARKMLHDQATSLNAMAREGVDFVGEQDIVEKINETLVIRDTKTSAKSPSPSMLDGAEKPGTADDSEQLTAYAVASHVVDGKLPDLMVLDYLVRTNARLPSLKYVPTKTTRNLDDVNVFLNRFSNAIHALKTGVFVPANQSWWGCSQRWCGFYDICPYAKRPKLVHIEGAKTNA